ncbi:hypothetical protein Ac2012v2_007863 [Leucoagaricus gongylophorus]
MSVPYYSSWQMSSHDYHHTNPLPPSVEALYPPHQNYAVAHSDLSYDSSSGPPQPVLHRWTPSPTPSEQKELGKGAIDWAAMINWRFWIRREWLWYYVALVVILVLTALMTLYHKQIVDWLTPITRWLHDLSFGWIVPIAILFVISFPPLFGHEIVAVLCGLVWGLWFGFAVVAAGTFLGEVGNFYAFKYCCRARGEKLERTNISYACLAQVVREGGFKIALVARLSAIPGHFTTAIFSTCGMNIFVFSIAAILSMPKQFITVYLGVLLEQSAEGITDTRSRIISDIVLAITILITVAAMWYILHRMNQIKPKVIYARRKARQAKLERQQISTRSTPNPLGNAGGTSYNTVNSSDSDIPLTKQAMPMGHNDLPGVSYFKEPSYETYLHAPTPQRPGIRIPSPSFQEDDLTTAQPLQLNNFYPLDERQASYSHRSFDQPLTPSPEPPHGSCQSGPSPDPPQLQHSPTQAPSPPINQAQSGDPFTSPYDRESLVPAGHAQEDSHRSLSTTLHTVPPAVRDLSSLSQRTTSQPASIRTTVQAGS